MEGKRASDPGKAGAHRLTHRYRKTLCLSTKRRRTSPGLEGNGADGHRLRVQGTAAQATGERARETSMNSIAQSQGLVAQEKQEP